MGEEKLRVKFLQAVLYVRKVLINTDVVAAHQRLMETSNAQYPKCRDLNLVPSLYKPERNTFLQFSFVLD